MGFDKEDKKRKLENARSWFYAGSKVCHIQLSLPVVSNFLSIP
jgi:hypothetical protein